jgi:hypothetical protein
MQLLLWVNAKETGKLSPRNELEIWIHWHRDGRRGNVLAEVEVQRNAVYRNLTQMCACTVGTEAA